MPKEPGPAGEENPQPLPQHPLVGYLKPDPLQPAERVTELTGLPGDSDRSGYQRLYLTTKLDYYAEFLVQDIVYTEAVPADESPSGRLGPRSASDETQQSTTRGLRVRSQWMSSTSTSG